MNVYTDAKVSPLATGAKPTSTTTHSWKNENEIIIIIIKWNLNLIQWPRVAVYTIF